MQMMDIPGAGGSMGMINLGDMLGKAMGPKLKRIRTNVVDAYQPLVDEEADKLLDEDQIVREALRATEEDGIQPSAER